MMKQTLPRFHTGIIALIVTALVLVACGAAATPPSATITSPTANAQFKAGDEVKIEGMVAGSQVKQVDIFVNGAKFATIDKAARPNEFDVAVTWTAPTDTAGANVIQLKGINEQGEAVVSSDAVFVTVEVPPTPTPEPTPVPTPIPTVAAPTAAPAPTASPALISPKAENEFVNVRAQPDINSQRLGQLNKGQSAPVRGKSADGKWFQINFPGAPDGAAWVLGEVAQLTGDANTLPVVQPGAAITGTATIVTPTTGTTSTVVATTAPAPAGLQPPFVRLKAGQDFANVRSGPDTAYDRLGQLDTANAAAAVKGKSANGQWWQISLASAPAGVAWVFGQLVDFTGDANAVQVAQAPPLPTAAAATAAPPAAPVGATATSIPAVPATPALPPSALLPYSQSDQFQPRNDIGDVPLGFNGEPRSSKWTWTINGAKSAELEIQAEGTPPDSFDCPAGNLAGVQPNSAAGKRLPVSLPSGSFDFSISEKGSYIFTLYIVKSDGSTTTLPRRVIVDCFKKPGR